MIHESLVDWFSAWPPWLAVFVVAMIPILEVRASVPLGLLAYDMSLWSVAIWSLLGNVAPVPVLLRFLPLVEQWAHRWAWTGRHLDRFFAFTRRRGSKAVEKTEEVGLALFVGVPLPGTGTWTGALVAHVLGLRRRPATISIAAGSAIAIVLVGAAVLSGRALWLLIV